MVKFYISALLVFLFFAKQTNASDLIEVKPLTNKILMLHFDDGYAVPHQKGQKRSDESVVVNPLDVTKASNPDNYLISSVEDANYGSIKNPLEVGRKSKGTEFTWLCQNWDNGCINSDPDHAKEHWIYLFLPNELKSGSTYTISLNNLASNKNEINFIYDEKELHSEAVHVNNIGYSTTAPAKFGYVYHWMGDKGALDLTTIDGKQFFIIDSQTKETVFSGSVIFRKSKTAVETGQQNDTPSKNFLGTDVYECDFSNFNTPGSYNLVVEGIGRSFTFEIGEDVYREPYYWTMKALYQNRSGIELLPQYTNHPRPAPHHPELTPGFAGKLKYSTTRFTELTTKDGEDNDKSKVEAGYKGTLETWGWYQDAGDWDGYSTHSHIPAFLMFLYEAGRNKFTDNELNIPESGNGIPDILDEAAWLLRYFKRTKDEIVEKGWGTGGIAGARVFGDLWGGDNAADGTTRGSWEDIDRDWYVLGEDPWMTYKYAAMAAQLAFILASEQLTDPNGVDWAKEAIEAYRWASTHSTSEDEKPVLDFKLKDIRLYASASLYRLTNNQYYHEKYKNEMTSTVLSEVTEENRDLSFATWIYTIMPSNRQIDQGLFTEVSNAISKVCNENLIATAEKRACRWGGNFYYPMLYGQATIPMVTSGIYGFMINKSKNPTLSTQYLKYLYTTADYFLGTNPLNMTWISGVGDRYPVGIFHMDWWYSDNKEIIKGIVPFGAHKVQDMGALGPWNPNWAYKTIYPAEINMWPGHERWFEQITSPPTTEFTVHKSIVVSAFVYGFLTKDKEVKQIFDVPDAPVGIDPNNFQGKLNIYPNPTSGTVSIKNNHNNFHISRVYLYSVDGKKWELKFKRKNQLEYEIILLNLESGTYILSLIDNKGYNFNKSIILTN